MVETDAIANTFLDLCIVRELEKMIYHRLVQDILMVGSPLTIFRTK